MLNRIVGAVAVLVVSVACAEQASTAEPQAAAAAEPANITELHAKLVESFPSLKVGDIQPSPAEGLYQISRGLSFGYVTADGKYFFDGDLIDIAKGVSLTEEARKQRRLAALDEIGTDNMIVFKAPNEKHTMTVFTDIDCGYCRKLHREIKDINDAGITVRYLFYPRSGPNTPSFAKADAVWCADDRNSAMTAAKAGQNVESDACETPVMSHYQTGQRMGVRGTPALILDDGSMQPGYLPAAQLAKIFAKMDS